MGALLKILSQDFDTGELVFYRTSFALVCLGAQVILFKQSLKTTVLNLHLKRSVVGIMALYLFFYSVGQLPLATAITLNNTSTLFLALLSWLMLGQRASKLTIMGLLSGFLGVAMILRPDLILQSPWAYGAGLLSGILTGYAYLQVKALGDMGEPIYRTVFYLSSVGTLGALGLIIATGGFSPFSPKTALLMLLMALFALLGQLCLTYAYQVGQKFLVAADRKSVV